ncbi:Inner membrane protein YhhQ [Tepidimonas alkaliphilus]|uniref:Probable queuosine precursor transporter n=1 Tax=Tepidimonas alkaliphilus TaxID=2588942 RepID=A0A554W956_9BURK|nr:7-cyano-7-deazaguanine/7-aminomethyl-7-deazaguanine transporter [Tepidimonas alkaliphilus]TSE20108.1 Inner membrane protein YhhQ [Tepidimonas alkaliphilus]
MPFIPSAPVGGAPHPLAPEALPRVVLWLSLLHTAVIIASNVLVQIPFEFGGVHTTWGAFTFPLVFVLTDLTVRVLGPTVARRVVARVMLPALVASYVVSVLWVDGRFVGWAGLADFNGFVFRIALASFAAYGVGQLTDIAVFARLRRLRAWWIAPAASTVVGSLIDTFVFFAAAFWHSPDAFMAEHWVEIAAVDYATKLTFSLLALLPLYGAALRALLRRLPQAAIAPAGAS